MQAEPLHVTLARAVHQTLKADYPLHFWKLHFFPPFDQDLATASLSHDTIVDGTGYTSAVRVDFGLGGITYHQCRSPSSRRSQKSAELDYADPDRCEKLERFLADYGFSVNLDLALAL